MNYRPLGRTGWNISEVSFGAWAIGGTWGTVQDNDSMAALHKAVEMGVNFFDTADVYGDGRSEQLLAQLRQDHSEEIIIATKIGRRLDPHTAAGYNNKENLAGFIERNLHNLQVDALDLVQLHCPPTDVYYMPEVFDLMDQFVQAGKIKHYGVSVEKVEEALKAIEYPNVKTVQIIFNMYRHRPNELFFQEAQKRQIGILARVPLASGMLTGKMTAATKFEADDHRLFNRNGEAFDKGETFSGVDYQTALTATDELKQICPENMSMVQFALRWILMHEAISCTIPGAKRPSQAIENIAAADLPPLSTDVMTQVKSIYDQHIRVGVHHYW